MPKLVKVKVCGITNEADLFACAEEGVDAVGFIIKEGHPSNSRLLDDGIAASVAASLISITPSYMSTVLIIRDADLQGITSRCHGLGPSVLQLVPDLPLQSLEYLRSHLEGVRLVKSIHECSAELSVELLHTVTALKASGLVDGIV